MNMHFACNMSALDQRQRFRHNEITTLIFESVYEVAEVDDGYIFFILPTPDILKKTVEFISLERLCCPFFNFNLELKSDSQTLWLHITGDEGIKPFILAELGGHLRQQLLQSLQLHRTR